MFGEKKEMTQDQFLTDLKCKAGDYPMLVFTRNLRSWLGSSISTVTNGTYNHFMWLIDFDTVATQDNMFSYASIRDYMEGEHILKFVIDTRWTNETRMWLQDSINTDLRKPWYKRLYDPVAIFGQLIHQPWIQLPWMHICSERGKYLKQTDIDFDRTVRHPSPTTINNFCKDHQALPENGMRGYFVVDRWLPEDL
jgi:hypothetical protein